MQVLVVNAGSSSLKLRFLDDRDQVFKSAGLPVRAPDINDRDLIRTLRDWPPPDVVGHRVVHGDHAADLIRIQETLVPDQAAQQTYADLRPTFDGLYDALVPAFRALRRMRPDLPLA